MFKFLNNEIFILNIAGTVKTIPMMFWRNSHINEVIINEGTEVIEDIAFFANVKNVKIAQSVKDISLAAFTTIGDGNITNLENVYGYKGSAAENLVKEYLEQAKSFAYDDWETYNSKYFHKGILMVDNSISTIDDPHINFIALDTVYTGETKGIDGEIKWEIAGNTLTISAVEGTQGRMKDYRYEALSPWVNCPLITDVKNVIIEAGVTKLGKLFLYLNGISIDNLNIAGTVKIIPKGFCEYVPINKLIINEGTEIIEEYAFKGRTENLQIAKSVKNISLDSFVLPEYSNKDENYKVNTTYLKNVYGYNGSTAEEFVKKYLEAFKNNNNVVQGYYYIENNISTYSDPHINFIALDEYDNSIIKVTVNGVQLDFGSIQPKVINGRTLIPMRDLFEGLGMEVKWNGESRTATASSKTDIIEVNTDNMVIKVNGEVISLDVPATIIGNSILIPIRAISESLNASVNWNDTTKTIEISTK